MTTTITTVGVVPAPSALVRRVCGSAELSQSRDGNTATRQYVSANSQFIIACNISVYVAGDDELAVGGDYRFFTFLMIMYSLSRYSVTSLY